MGRGGGEGGEGGEHVYYVVHCLLYHEHARDDVITLRCKNECELTLQCNKPESPLLFSYKKSCSAGIQAHDLLLSRQSLYLYTEPQSSRQPSWLSSNHEKS